MKKNCILTLIPINTFAQPFISLDDEFNKTGKVSTSIYSSLFIDNSSDFLFRNPGYQLKNNEKTTQNYNSFNITPSINYNLYNNFIINTTVSGNLSNYNLRNNTDFQKESEFYFDFLSLGFLYKKNTESSVNKIIGFNINLIEDYGLGTNYLKSLSGRYLIYNISDPLINNLEVGVKYNLKRNINEGKYSPKSYLYLRPSFDFLINPTMTIGLGTEIKFSNDSNLNGKVIEPNYIENRVFINYSHILETDKRWIISSEYDTTGKSGSTISLGFNFKI
jgi:hypothetical protein